MKLPKSFTTVTLFSKSLALALFLLLPVLGFYLGMEYQKSLIIKDSTKLIVKNINLINQQKEINKKEEKTYSLKIPTENDWIEYQATCDNLKNNIIIYYPKNWFVTEFPNVGDTNTDMTKYECQVLFGYAKKPISYQYSEGDGGIYFKVATWISNSQSLEQYLDQYPGPGVAKTVSKIIINNQTFYKEKLTLSTDNSGGYRLLTSKNNRFFTISFPGKHVAGLDIDDTIDVIFNEFMERLKIL